MPFFSGILSLGWLPCPPARTFCVAPSILEADILDLFIPRSHTGGCVKSIPPNTEHSMQYGYDENDNNNMSDETKCETNLQHHHKVE